MRKNILKDLGTINIEQIEVSNGQLEIFVPVEVISNELDAVLEKCAEDYKEHYPEVETPSFCMRLVFSFGYTNPEFELLVMKNQKTNLENTTVVLLEILNYQQNKQSRLKK